MINALSMVMVRENDTPHPSHQFGPKDSTLVACASNDRYGQVRTCKKCEANEVWAGGPGSHYFDQELFSKCFGFSVK